VEFRYESTALRLGLVISLTTCVAFGVLSAALVARQIRTRRWTWPSVGSGAGGCGTDAMGL
jgi:hypothetical protein